MPVSRQLMPRMWLSPSPRTLLDKAVQDQHPVLERLQRRHDFLELEILARFVGPEGGRDRAVRAEHDDQPLARAGRTGEAEARQAHEERQRGGGEAQLLDELPAMDGVHFVLFTRGAERLRSRPEASAC